MNRILSGIQPTGHLHLGNYLGAIRNWVELQYQYECLFCVVDLHALTTSPDPKQLKVWTRQTAAAYIACGIDITKNAIFPQSAVAAHSELAWIFSCLSPMGWLNRMTQFKEKAGKDKEKANLGLYAYPVLMAADILIYKATHVPVGEDQKQHLELARDLAGAFNRQYNQEYFFLPEPLIMKESARIMSLRDGSKKMSKSEESDYSRINFTDTADDIRLKIRKAKTDAEALQGSLDKMQERPETINLVNIYASLAKTSPQKVCEEFEGVTFSVLKEKLTDLLIATFEPIRLKMDDLLKHFDHLDQILGQGTETATKLADTHIKEVKAILGLF